MTPSWQIMGVKTQANILDPIHAGLDDRVWDHPMEDNPRLKPKHRHWIMRTVRDVLERAGYEDIDHWLSLVITGSLTTYQYSEESDMDVSLFVNTSAFPDWSRAEMIAVMVENVDGVTLPGTPFLMQCYVVPPEVTRDDLYQPGLRSGYDLDADEWIEPPDRSRVHDVEHEMYASYATALEAADKMEKLLRYEPDKAVLYWHQIHDRRRRDMQAGKGDYSDSNIIYKMLANRGLFPEIAEVSGEYIAKTAEFGLKKEVYPDLPCPKCKQVGGVTFDILDRIIHCRKCGGVTQLGGDYDLRQWADLVDYRSPEGVGEGWEEVGDSVIPPHMLPSLGPPRQGAASERVWKWVFHPELGGNISDEQGVTHDSLASDLGYKWKEGESIPYAAGILYGDGRAESYRGPIPVEYLQQFHPEVKPQSGYTGWKFATMDPKWRLDSIAVDKAARHLGITLPVRIRVVGGTHGRYLGVIDGKHVIEAIWWLNPERASFQIWHELAHALQAENGMEFQPRPDRYDEYRSEPHEVEADRIATEAPFSVVLPIKVARPMDKLVRKFVFNVDTGELVVGDMGPEEGSLPSHNQLAEQIGLDFLTNEYLLGTINRSGYVQFEGGSNGAGAQGYHACEQALYEALPGQIEGIIGGETNLIDIGTKWNFGAVAQTEQGAPT